MNTNPGYFIWLSELCGAGSSVPKKAYELCSGDVEILYRADRDVLLGLGFSEDEAELLSDKDFERANRIIDFCSENMIGLLCFGGAYYPERLYEIDNPPPVLYFRGNIEKLRSGAYVTAIGSRDCTDRGIKNGYALSFRLSCSGMTVVTGLASGIDAACTLGALDGGGFAIGVLGCGINICYPSENAPLYERMFRQGLVISEFAPYTEPKGTNFPIRNRIMAALGSCALVIEARKNSGALITADYAVRYGRKLFAVPGEIDNPKCEGSNQLIRDGAASVFDEMDILSDFMMLYPDKIIHRRESRSLPDECAEVLRKPPNTKNKKKKSADPDISSKKNVRKGNDKTTDDKVTDTPVLRDLSPLSDTERAVYELIYRSGKTSADALSAELSITAEEVLAALTMLEIYGYVESSVGGTFIAI